MGLTSSTRRVRRIKRGPHTERNFQTVAASKAEGEQCVLSTYNGTGVETSAISSRVRRDGNSWKLYRSIPKGGYAACPASPQTAHGDTTEERPGTETQPTPIYEEIGPLGLKDN